jgi:hypothetical protein
MSPSSFWNTSAPGTCDRLIVIEFEVQVPVILTARIEALSTPRTSTSAVHILVDAQNIFTRSAKHCLFVPLIPWPYAGLMGLLCIMAADAGVEFLAAEMFDGDDV